jgi:hypothetical protein
MRAFWTLSVILAGCAASLEQPTQRVYPAFRAPSAPFADVEPPVTAEPPLVFLEAESDVILRGRLPTIFVRAGNHGIGAYNKTTKFSLLNPDGSVNQGPCNEAAAPPASSGFAALSFECHPIRQLGVHRVRFDPAPVGLQGAPVELSFRVLDALPAAGAAPKGWKVTSLISGRLDYGCYGYGTDYRASVERNGLVVQALSRARSAAPLPRLLTSRLSREHANVVTHVFEADDGWIVMFDHGEFGGGIEWYARDGGAPRPIMVGPHHADEINPQNVSRAVAADGVIYVLQGISHMGISQGQLARIWREHDHFTSHVIARFDSEPFDWTPLEDGGWLVATWQALWRVTSAGKLELVARLPGKLSYPNSLARDSRGAFYIGTRGGILRLTPTWPDEPRYAAEFLWDPDARQRDCSPQGESGAASP